MPKVVDHDQRRQELGQAVWRVIHDQGVDAATVRAVAHEAGWSPGALRHYFSTQSDLIASAMQVVVDRVEDRLAGLDRDGDPRRAVDRVLYELLPLDDQRRSENTVWMAFTARALVDPELRARQGKVQHGLRSACTWAIETLVAGGRASPRLNVALEAQRLHALVDGLAFHTAMQPEEMPPGRIVAVIAYHLDTLEEGGPRPDW